MLPYRAPFMPLIVQYVGLGNISAGAAWIMLIVAMLMMDHWFID